MSWPGPHRIGPGTQGAQRTITRGRNGSPRMNLPGSWFFVPVVGAHRALLMTVRSATRRHETFLSTLSHASLCRLFVKRRTLILRNIWIGLIAGAVIGCQSALPAPTPTHDLSAFRPTGTLVLPELPSPDSSTPTPIGRRPEELLYTADTGQEPSVESLRPYAQLLDILSVRCQETREGVAIDAENVLAVLRRDYGKETTRLDALRALEFESQTYEARGFGYCPVIQLMHDAAARLDSLITS